MQIRCLVLFDYTLCKVELYAAEIATGRDECNDNRIFIEAPSVSIALMKRELIKHKSSLNTMNKNQCDASVHAPRCRINAIYQKKAVGEKKRESIIVQLSRGQGRRRGEASELKALRILF